MSDFDETLNEEELNIITLTDEDGTDKDFEFLDLIDLDDKEYVVLLPVESEDENADGEVIILEVHSLMKTTKNTSALRMQLHWTKYLKYSKRDSKTILILSINSYEGNRETVIPPLNHSFPVILFTRATSQSPCLHETLALLSASGACLATTETECRGRDNLRNSRSVFLIVYSFNYLVPL